MKDKNEHAFEELAAKAAYALMIADRNATYGEKYEVVLTEVRVKFPTETQPEFLVVLKGHSDGGPVVAFHQGSSFFEVLPGALRRLQNKDLKWKEDRPWGG